jgi:hypothetical protein
MENLLDGFSISDIALMEATLWVQIPLRAAGKIIKDDDLVARIYISVRHVRCDESSSSGH